MPVIGVAPLMGVHKFERFFRAVASLDVDKNDLKRYNDFVNQKLGDLMIRGQAGATANGRDIIETIDLPITKGLQESIHNFRKIEGEQDIELQPILEHLAQIPQINMTWTVETETQLPEIMGGLSVALGRAMKIIDPALKNPETEHWERAFQIFDLLL